MKRSEVWLINLDSTIGVDVRKTRPVVIVNDDSMGILPLKIIVPITAWKHRYNVAPWMVRLEPDPENGLNKSSVADAFRVRTVSQGRFVRRRGKLSEASMQEITKALAIVLCIDNNNPPELFKLI